MTHERFAQVPGAGGAGGRDGHPVRRHRHGQGHPAGVTPGTAERDRRTTPGAWSKTPISSSTSAESSSTTPWRV